MENIIDTATENNETLVAKTSSTDDNNYLQPVVSFTVTYIENFLNINSCDFIIKFRFIRCINKVSTICTNTETFRRMIILLTDLNNKMTKAMMYECLNWERVKQLTSPSTPYEAIKYFMEHAGTGIHPCVVVEIILKWWSERTDREHVDMSFITPLITTIQNVNSEWYYHVSMDERYEGLIRRLDIPKPAESRYMYYNNYCYYDNNNKRVLKDCISKGDGTPAQLEDLVCSDNMERYKHSVFRYNAVVFPPYGDTKHHWYIATENSYIHVSLIANSKEEILDYINNGRFINLDFVPLPDTLQ